MSILRLLIKVFSKAVFATLKSFINDSSNTIFISLAAVVPQILNEIDSPEAVNFM